MGLTTLLRGFKVPIVVLDRFLAAHGIQETEHLPPHLFRGLGGMSAATQQVDPQSAFFRARLAASNPDPTSLDSVRLFVPHRRGQDPSAYGYVAYTFVMVFGQRHVDLAVELPEQAPPGFAALRREMLGFAAEDEQVLLQAAGMQDPRAESKFFVVITDSRELPLERPFVRESDLRCQQCADGFETLPALHLHKSELHGVDIMSNPFLDDL
ncbi:uncharacterized protein B0H64DRAFT_184615 [Chaetomium fimeti]|uniref:C2H2-type domain-containing protein n=1 Tax=Chaetomium fimeti TaxID=1854472 RepID=A0AAE0LR88_9PEZI|nr:hypothetical protein B0H64DRAFT_184615 [Chaetomium fimeti]